MSQANNVSRQKIVALRTKALKQRDTMIEKIASRVQYLTDNNQHVAAEWARIVKHINDDSFVNSLALLDGALDIAGFTDKLANVNKSDRANYVQAKTVEKIVRMVHAFALRDLSKLDTYQQQVINNALHNAGDMSITACQASLSRRVECEGLREQIKSRASYTTGTASSQTGQVRDVLRVLGLAEVNKGKRGDVFKLNQARMNVLREIFDVAQVEESEESEA